MSESLAGLDDVDWASLVHAYGDASDVPDLLRGLTSADSRVRDASLDALYGGVHHQGDVYDSTLACLPFLCALAADTAIGDRDAVLRFLDSVGESADAAARDAGDDIPDPHAVIAVACPDDWSEQTYLAYGLVAGEMLRAGLTALTPLLGDAEPGVRAEAALLLARHGDDPMALLDMLVERVDVEEIGAVRQAVVEALAQLIERLRKAVPSETDGPSTEEPTRRAVVTLSRLATSEGDPGATFAALAGLARHAPAAMPTDAAERAIAVITRLVESGPGDMARVSGPASDARLPSELGASSRAMGERTARALGELHHALGDRLADRQRILLHELRHARPGGRAAVLERVTNLHNGWRVPEPELTVAALAPLFADAAAIRADDADADTQGVIGAVTALRDGHLPLTPALLDAATAIAEVAVYPSEDWQWTLGGRCIRLLIHAGDARAVARLVPLLDGRDVPGDLPRWCERLGPHAAGLIPALNERLRQSLALPETLASVSESSTLLAALLTAGARDIPEIAPFLARLADRSADNHGFVEYPGLPVLETPGGLGVAGLAAVPVLRRMLANPNTRAGVDAARALWQAGEDAHALLPVLAEVLDRGGDSYARHLVREFAIVLGQDAAPLLPHLRASLADALPATAAHIALTLRAVDPAERESTDDTLRRAWSADRGTRGTIATGLRRELRAGGRPPADFDALLRAELAEPRRVGNTGKERDRGRYDADADEALRASCRALLGDG
jgi:hypothetical protein